MRRAFLLVALLAFACLLFRAARTGLAGDYVDPVSRITTADEAMYGSSVISMATQGDWLTPHFMGRMALYKPPLLICAAALSARLFGISRLSLRLPVALLCAFAVGLVFLFAAELNSWQSGVCAAVLLTSSHLWHVLATACMTDGILAACCVAAVYCLFADPWLESRAALWGFACAVAAAILVKSVAGILPLGVLGLYWLSAPRKYKPAFLRVCLAAALSLALAAPWFLYQLTVHHRWFWTEHVALEILGWGAGAPPQTSQESHAMFYLVRMALMDPVLVAVAAVAVPAFATALRKRSFEATLLVCWAAIVVGSVSIWEYRNVSYLLPLLPALAIAGASYGPFSTMRPSWWMLALTGAAFALKLGAPTSPAGISFATGTVQPVAPIVSSYCSQRRGNELILVSMDDNLYASTLPLARLRYALVQPPADSHYLMDFESMGIILTAAQFNDLPRFEPAFRDRLRQWGMDSPAPIGTVIMTRSLDELASVIAAHPASDFLLPERYRPAADSSADHLIVDAAPGHLLVLSRTSLPSLQQSWSCSL